MGCSQLLEYAVGRCCNTLVAVCAQDFKSLFGPGGNGRERRPRQAKQHLEEDLHVLIVKGAEQDDRTAVNRPELGEQADHRAPNSRRRVL